MKIKKIIAAIAAAAMSVSALAFSASAADIGQAYIAYADEEWAVQYWGTDAVGVTPTNATITGDGSYTVKLDFDAPNPYATFTAVIFEIPSTGDSVDGHPTDYPDMDVKVTSVKANGAEVAGLATQAFIAEESKMRINLYNPWATEYNYLSDLSWSTDISNFEVTFEVTGTGVGGAAADAAPAADTTAAPAADTATPSAATGNTTTAVILSVMAVAGAAAIVAKKRK